ncbi:MAG: hypothetical protein ABIQ73_04760 [Acidimicrobiales bacterium]
MRKTSVLAATVAAAALMVPTAASAAPRLDPANVITVTCPGTPYNGVVIQTPPNDGGWTPAFIGHTTFVPVSFGEFTGTFTANNGEVFGPFTDPPRVQNANKGGNNPRLACTFTVLGRDENGTFAGTGGVVVVVVGKP